MATKDIEALVDLDGIDAAADAYDGAADPYRFVGEDKWYRPLEHAVALSLSTRSDLHIHVWERTIIAHNKDQRVVCVVMHTNHDIIKSINRNIRQVLSVNPVTAFMFGIDWSKEPLGKMPDVDLALMLGCSAQAVGRARDRLGIPAYRKKGKWVNPDA